MIGTFDLDPAKIQHAILEITNQGDYIQRTGLARDSMLSNYVVQYEKHAPRTPVTLTEPKIPRYLLSDLPSYVHRPVPVCC